MFTPRARLALFAVLCAVVLLPRMGGPHVHLCLDGSAPPVAFHMSDGAGNEGLAGTDEGHQDQTVDVSNPVLGKVWPPGLDGALFLVILLMCVVLRPALVRPVPRNSPLPAPPLFLRPPLRGPPA